MSVGRYLGATFPLDRFPNFRRGKIQSVGIWFSATIASIPVAWNMEKFLVFSKRHILRLRAHISGTRERIQEDPFYITCSFLCTWFHCLWYPCYIPGLSSAAPQRYSRTRYSKNKTPKRGNQTKGRTHACNNHRCICHLLASITSLYCPYGILGSLPDVHNAQLPFYVQYLSNWLGHANSATTVP